MSDLSIIDVTPENIETYPPLCFMKKGTEGAKLKMQWYLENYPKGLRVKILYSETLLAGLGSETGRRDLPCS